MSVKGFWALRLDDYVRGANPDAIVTMTDGWEDGRRAFSDAGKTMSDNANKASDGFSETSASGAAIKNSMVDSSKFAHEKRDKVRDAIDALDVVRLRVYEAMKAKAEIDHDLPGSHPSVNPADFPTDAKQVGKRQAEANDTALAQARADHAAREAAIADAERKAAAKVQAVDAAVIDADPKVRALIDPDNTRQERPSGSPTAVPGSYSDIAAARARAANYNAGVMYPGGWGHDLKAAELENIKEYEAQNRPEWDNEKGQWINFDGSPAPATSYAMVETADGLAPLGGGTGGAAALAIGAGGALLSAGVAKAIASKFGGGAAKAATAGTTSRSAATKSATAARAGGGAGARTGAAGAGSRAAGAGARGAGARGAGAAGGRGTAGAGSRAGSRAGAGAGAGRGGKKDDPRNGQDQDWQADYTEDWTETASDVLDPNASRGWVPNASNGDDSGDDASRR
ncbi:hypothetical protein [Nocardioides albus]|uniref:Uncharacterized protein n=1 Tax=Nocardioides albus TaxID=1841 RepID=A0A7W5F7B2_9ACTN|nr:hypothetical protein [Nocardioides albus]MBB3087969.1 hypothetical protein [Nocardioides albus]GGU21658.1 hypothetical protein GCM10007979_20360 [Nocardioides albus]